MEPIHMRTATPIRGNKFQRATHVCEVCGKPSVNPICSSCSDKIRAEAVARKRREDKGLE